MAVSDLRSWQYFKGNFADYFNNTWYPEIKKWCLAYRPDDLFRCNTNNGTERLNEELKHNELDGYKNCTLSELMCVMIESFLPNLYEKYVSLNVQYTTGYKGYSKFVPEYMINRPGPLVDFMIEKLGKVTPDMVSSVHPVLVTFKRVFAVTSVSPESYVSSVYLVNFGDEETICSCECRNFKRYRLICQHFFAVFESKWGSFCDISPLFLNHPYTNIDFDVIGNVQLFGPGLAPAVSDEVTSSASGSNNNMNLTAPLPAPRKWKVKVTRQKVLSDLKVLQEKLYNITNHESHIQDLLGDVMKEANDALQC